MEIGVQQSKIEGGVLVITTIPKRSEQVNLYHDRYPWPKQEQHKSRRRQPQECADHPNAERLRQDHHLGAGDATPDSYDSATLSFFASIVVPTVPMLIVYMTVKGWKSLLNDRVFLWQAWLSTIVFVGVCFAILLGVAYAVIWADYHVELKTEAGGALKSADCNLQIVARVQRICTYGGIGLGFSLMFGIMGLDRKGTP